MLSNLESTKDGTYFFYNVGKGNFTETGQYSYTYNCGNAVNTATGRIYFDVSYTGKELSEVQTSIYAGSIFILAFFFVLLILLINKLPSKDTTDDAGSILQVSNLKHLRPVLWAVAWTIILAIMFIAANITIAFLPTSMIGGLFFALYTMMFWITVIGLPLWFAWIFVGIFKDKEVKRMLERGVDMKASL